MHAHCYSTYCQEEDCMIYILYGLLVCMVVGCLHDQWIADQCLQWLKEDYRLKTSNLILALVQLGI